MPLEPTRDDLDEEIYKRLTKAIATVWEKEPELFMRAVSAYAAMRSVSYLKTIDVRLDNINEKLARLDETVACMLPEEPWEEEVNG
jgi:hypothetical protein